MRRPHRLASLLTRQNASALILLLVGLLLLVWLRRSHLDLFTAEGMRQTVARLGVWGPLVYIGVLAMTVVVSQIPGVPLAIAAGAVWGAPLATVYSVIGGFCGSLIAYFLGRSLGRSTLKALTGKAVYFSKHRGEVYLGWIIFVTRLLPVISFDLVSYGAGITGLSLPIYAIATLFGMIPSTFLLTYMGESLTMKPMLAIAYAILFTLILIFLPWGIHRYNWFGLQDVIRIE